MSLSVPAPSPAPSPAPGSVFAPAPARAGRLLDEVTGLYSSVFGSQSGPHRQQHPVVFLPDGSSKPCRQSGQMSAMGYLAFVLSVINSVVNAANNVNNNENNNNNNNNDNNNNNNNVNIQSSNNNQNNQNMAIAGRAVTAAPRAEVARLQERLALHYSLASNQTRVTMQQTDPADKLPTDRTVLLPLIKSRQGKVAETVSTAGGALDSIRDTLTSYLPSLARAGARAGRSAEPRCEMSAADTAAVAAALAVARDLLQLLVTAEARGRVPRPAEVCASVSGGGEEGGVVAAVARTLVRPLLASWGLAHSSLYWRAVSLGLAGRCHLLPE